MWQVEKAGDSQTRETCSRDCRGLDEFDRWKINAISLDIPRRKLPTHQLRVRTDKKIGQRHTRRFALVESLL
jgi:hypothetical protein